MGTTGNTVHREPWNEGKIVGQRAPFKPKDTRALRVLLNADLPAHQEPARRATAAWTFQAGIDGEIPRDRRR